MTKRTSVSINGLTYQRVQNYVRNQGGTVAGFIQEIIEALEENTDSPSEHPHTGSLKEENKTNELEGYVPPITMF